MVNCCLALSVSTANWKSVFVSMVKIKAIGVDIRQGCVLSPLLFIIHNYINWIDKCSQTNECATIGNCKISHLLFTDDSVLLFFTKSGLQRTAMTLQLHVT